MCHHENKHGFMTFVMTISFILATLCGLYKILSMIATDYHRHHLS